MGQLLDVVAYGSGACRGGHVLKWGVWMRLHAVVVRGRKASQEVRSNGWRTINRRWVSFEKGFFFTFSFTYTPILMFDVSI